MPNTFVGLALFVAFITPGYLWVRAEERSRPRPERSQLLEVAQLLMVGAVASLTALSVVATLGAHLRPFLNLAAWVAAPDPAEYVSRWLPQALRSLLLTVFIAHGATYTAATWWFSPTGARVRSRSDEMVRKLIGMTPRTAPRIDPAHTPWFDVLGSIDKSTEVAVLTVVQDGGRVVVGLLRSYDVAAAADKQDLALQAPISYQSPGGALTPVAVKFAVIPGGTISRVFIDVKPRSEVHSATKKRVMDRSASTPLATAGALLGVGLGGLFDGILLHQVLQWHHLLSTTEQWGSPTPPNIRINTMADGLFHAITWILVPLGLTMLWRAIRTSPRSAEGRRVVAWTLVGWGVFNVVEGTISHHLLEIHRVRPDAGNPLAWDLGYLTFGLGLIAAGWLLRRGPMAVATATAEQD